MSTDEALWDLLSRATVRISDGANGVRGSGFFIEPGSVLTAAHVIAEAEGPLSLELHDGRKCHIVNTVEALPGRRPPGQTVWPLPDVAVLSAQDEFLDHEIPFVEMSEGYPGGEVLISGVAMGITGQLADDRARLRFEATRKEGETTLLKLAGGVLEPGMSGGPVLDPASGKVVGLVKADRGNNGAFVVSGGSIAAAMPARWASHREAHRRDPRWRLEAGRTRYAEIEPTTLSQYLEALTAENRISPMLPSGLDRAQVSQPTRVRPRRSIGNRIETNTGSHDLEGEEADSGEAFLWDPLRSPWPSVAVVAGPGMGKSWLLTHHAVTIGQQSLDRVRESPSVSVDVPLPVVVSAAAFARRLDADPDLAQVTEALGATVLRAIGQGLDPAQVTSLLGLALEDLRVVLCVDGVDEVPDDLRERLRAALARLDPLVAQLVVSGRESARPTLERVFGGEHEEFAITGFAPGDVRRFVRSWHRDRPQLISEVEGTLRDSPGLRTLMHVPLLLSFVCRLATEGHSLATTRSGLYRAVALNVLSGKWRGPEPVKTDPVVRLNLLADAVGPLAARWRSRPDEFTEHDVEMALRSHPSYAIARDAALGRWRSAESYLDRSDGPEPTAPVIWEFLHDGLLIRTQGPQGEQLLRFSHLVFGELCVAMWLARLDTGQQAEQIEQHRWFDRHWDDIIPIACGVAKNPEALLSRLTVPDDDPWLAEAQLLANCMVEVPGAAGQELVEGLVSTLVQRLARGPGSDAQAARSALKRLLVGRVEHADGRLVKALQNRELPASDKGFAMRLLCQVGEVYAVEKCKELVGNPSVPKSERDEAAGALCSSGDQSAVEIVISSFSTQRGNYQNLAVALARGEASSRAALDLVQRRDVDQTLRVAVAVEQLQSNGIETAAQQLLADPSLGLAGQVALTVALLRAGQPVDSVRANELLKNPNVTQQGMLELVHTLLLRSELAALLPAADLVVNIDVEPMRRRALAQTMFSIGAKGARTLFLSATRSHVQPEARLQALLVLIERRHAEACRAASALIANGEGERWVSAQLLGALLAHAPGTVEEEEVVAMLADRDLSEGRAHLSWEDLAVGALRSGSADLRARVAERIKRRVGTIDHEPTDLASIDVSRLLSVLAASGSNCLDLLVEIASDPSATIDARVDTAMAAALGDVTRVEELQRILDDPEVPEPVLLRLAVAFAMLGAAQMLARMAEILPSSEPAYVALRAILQSEAVDRETVSSGVEHGREAVNVLRDADPVTWDLDFPDLALELSMESRSDTERQLQLGWAADTLQAHTYARLISLLLPSERVALYRAGGFIDTEVTRDWLATWVPGYLDVAQAEVALLQERLDSGRETPPELAPGTAMSPFESLAQAARLLGEWWAAVEKRDRAASFHLLSSHHELFESALMRDTNLVASGIDSAWPRAQARGFLLWTASEPDGIETVGRLISKYGAALDTAKGRMDGGSADLALGAASVAVLLWPHDAAGYFYAAEAMLVLGGVDQAKSLISESAKLATGPQAAQGRKSLREFGERHEIDQDVIEEMRDILGTALEGQDIDGEPDPSGPPDARDDAEEGDDSGEAGA